jgi:hypothetical protein
MGLFGGGGRLWFDGGGYKVGMEVDSGYGLIKRIWLEMEGIRFKRKGKCLVWGSIRLDW